LRGIAALVVVTRHVPDPMLKNFFPGGYLAVDFFFALSGFVLAHAYQDKLGRGLTATTFMVLRYIRILPQYLFALALGSALICGSLLTGHSEVSLIRLIIACIFGFLIIPIPPHIWSGGSALFPLNLPAWSLFFELLVNFFYGCGASRLSTRGLLGLLGVAGALLVATAVWHGNLDGGGDWATLPLGFVRVTFSYFAGIAVYRLRSALSFSVRFPSLLPGVFLAVLLAIPAAHRALLDVGVTLLFLPVLLLGSANFRSGSVVAILGRTSYGVYVLHFPLVAALDLLCRKLLGMPLIVFGVAGTLITVIMVVSIAACLEFWIDGPLRNRFRRFIVYSAPGMAKEEQVDRNLRGSRRKPPDS
jgi:peptidoglycan/LPS O-acetylase OafA/YrhL